MTFYVLFVTLSDFEFPVSISLDSDELYDLKSSYETFLSARCRIFEFSSDTGIEV